jgi:hypothetical protein
MTFFNETLAHVPLQLTIAIGVSSLPLPQSFNAPR